MLTHSLIHWTLVSRSNFLWKWIWALLLVRQYNWLRPLQLKFNVKVHNTSLSYYVIYEQPPPLFKSHPYCDKISIYCVGLICSLLMNGMSCKLQRMQPVLFTLGLKSKPYCLIKVFFFLGGCKNNQRNGFEGCKVLTPPLNWPNKNN